MHFTIFQVYPDRLFFCSSYLSIIGMDSPCNGGENDSKDMWQRRYLGKSNTGLLCVIVLGARTTSTPLEDFQSS